MGRDWPKLRSGPDSSLLGSDRLALAAVVAPFVVAAVALAVGSAQLATPGGDHALLELGTREALRGQRALGPYSRFGWHHPGPALFYALALPYALLGGPVGLHVGALLVNGVAAAASVAVVRRVAGPAVTPAAAAVVLMLAWSLGPRLLADPWNPHIVVLALLLCAVLVVGAATAGPAWFLAAAAAVGSFCVQSHVGLAPPVTALVTGGTVATLRRRPSRAQLLAPAVLAWTAVAVTLWLPPLAEQLTSGDGNLGRLLAFAGRREGHSVAAVLAGVARGMATLPLGAPGLASVPATPTATVAAAAGAALAAALVAAAAAGRRGQGLARGLALAAVGTAAAATVAASRVSGPLLGYLLTWAVVASALGWLAAAVALAAPPDGGGADAVRRDRAWRLRQRLAGAVVAVLALALALPMATARPPFAARARTTAAVVVDPAVAYVTDRGVDNVVVRLADRAQWSAGAALASGLHRAGVGVSVAGGGLEMFGTSRRPTGQERLELVLSHPAAIAPQLRHAEVVASSGRTLVRARPLGPDTGSHGGDA